VGEPLLIKLSARASFLRAMLQQLSSRRTIGSPSHRWIDSWNHRSLISPSTPIRANSRQFLPIQGVEELSEDRFQWTAMGAVS
jgi:hypothetical protein